MTPEEAPIMQRHVDCCAGQLQQGKVLAFGPVADPNSACGSGIIMLAEGKNPNVGAIGYCHHRTGGAYQ